MSRQFVFNPFTGKFDVIDVTDTSTLAKPTPTTMQADLTIPDYTQMLARQRIVGGSFSIIGGVDASLIGV